jgi:4-amino-4-deoxy-L-arabinose transferase-like glycosyltransferase
MFTFAFFIGIYSYCIFALGMFDLLTRLNIIYLTVIWFIVLFFFEKEFLTFLFKKISKGSFSLKKIYKDTIFLFILLFIVLALVNLIGALGPELAFDALWYHLTLPQLFLLNHSLYHIPGSLLYYSDMPKLGEMLYVGALSLGNEITAKVIHYLFGILAALALYKVSRKFFNTFISVLVVVIFYSNLVVDTESITAYIDLIRTFFEIMTLWAFLNWYKTSNMKWLVTTGIMTGLAVTTKVLGIGSIIVFSTMFIVAFFESRFKMNLKKDFGYLFLYCFIALLIPLPWFIFSFLHTGNPVYPFFTHTYSISSTQFGITQFVVGLWNLFMYSPDPISPIYLIFLPLLFLTYSKFQKEIKLIVLYCVLDIILWYFTPQTGGGRFILPYLPAFSLICGTIYSEILKKTRMEWKYLSRLLLFVIIFVSFISIGYRFIANSKYIPVLLGKETKSQFLSNHLNFSFGDFYDTDNYFATHIKASDMVLLYGFHNLYYVDFPYVDISWVQKRYKFDYIAVQNTKISSKYANWQLVYFNDKTKVRLYQSKNAHFQAYP